ncbi:MAG: SDR family oxidoreductase [Halobacteriovoraceae bacterium]|nr:SDR family oxidoreductase [Halobacteriovoraceae bacterium]
MKILIFGKNGMLGHTLTQFFKSSEGPGASVLATTRRSSEVSQEFPLFNFENVKEGRLQAKKIFEDFQPDFVMNCIGVIKQVDEASLAETTIKINSLLPHTLENICQKYGSKLIHFSTDCVFSGRDGNYCEDSTPDAYDLYGRSKLLGEVTGESTLTLRTSIIGHEIGRSLSLIDWFLSQKNNCRGFTEAIYTGFPTIVLAKILNEKILPEMNKGYHGMRHLSSEKINKHELLSLVAKEYGKTISIAAVDEPKIDRSLNSELLRKELNFVPPSWGELVSEMYKNYKCEYEGKNGCV